jgi:hypothetical protein
MGVGLQIVYVGFAGTARIESEAGVRLVRLERFARRISGRRLAIEALRGEAGQRMYDARLDLITRAGESFPVAHCSNEDVEAAVRAAFDAAERELERKPSEAGV